MSFKNAAGKAAAERAIKSSIKDTFRAVKKPPKQLYEELLQQNDTRFSAEELERLFTAFSILSKDRLQRSQFTDLVTQEIGWSSALLRDQLFKAFDRHGDGELDFVDFCRGYSTFLRGAVLDLVDFAWSLFKVTEDSEEEEKNRYAATFILRVFLDPYFKMMCDKSDLILEPDYLFYFSNRFAK